MTVFITDPITIYIIDAPFFMIDQCIGSLSFISVIWFFVEHNRTIIKRDFLIANVDIKQHEYETKRDFALMVNKTVASNIRPFFFQNAEKYMSRDLANLTHEEFEVWLRSKWKRFDWKD